MAKMDKKWVLLCSTAVAGVYAAGFFTTEAQATKVESQPHPQISVQSKVANSQVASSHHFDQTSVAKSKVIAPKVPKIKHMYKEGTFTGMGENRRGSIQVAVTIKNDKITDVEISDFAMHYSEDDIVGLPNEVIKKQSAKIENVSGATYSTRAFEDAVREALDQAHNA